MNNITEKVVFKTRARLLNQLGEQLIKDESIALLELIKNSYDADASCCDVTIINPLDMKNGIIRIIDDGHGMNLDILKKSWLEIGTSFKDDLHKSHEKYTTPKFKRKPLGEKGIGRLGVHKLGKRIRIISKMRDSKECILEIDWDKINDSYYLEEFPVILMENNVPEYFSHDNTGTLIEIFCLKQEWNKGLVRECNRVILSLNSPFKSYDSFTARLEVPETDWLKGLFQFEDIEKCKLFSFDIFISGEEIKRFDYQFLPWKTMPKLKSRFITEEDSDISIHKRIVDERSKKRTINLNNHNIGTVRFKGIIFDLDSKILNLGVVDKKGLKNYLKTNGGISVFRDNMRILNYGEPGIDWLDLSGRRINSPAKKISNNIIIGSVYLDREESSDLLEKANREGFIENNAYLDLKYALRYLIDRIESLRQVDKNILRKHYSTQSKEEPVISTIAELQDVINSKIKDESIKTEITRYLQRIERDYSTICNNLIKSAGAGLNLIVVIHQMEKIIKNIISMISSEASMELIGDNVVTLSNLVKGYSILVKKSEVKTRNLKGILNQCIFNTKFRLKAHGIELNDKYKLKTDMLDGICSEDHFLNCLMNVMDNSIWWLGYSKVNKPSIYIDMSNELEGYNTIVIADNGPGFTLPTEEIVQPFISDKVGGMGIGLHLVDQIMQSLGGKILFPDYDMFCIPEKYKNGAIVALAFKIKD